MRARAALKAATDDLHGELDGLLGRLDLSRPDDYRAFLAIQARVLPPVEQALTDGGIAALVEGWPAHRRASLLASDLEALGEPLPVPAAVPRIDGAPALLGTAYVIEGSRLGGRFLAREVGAGMPAEFLRAPEQKAAWPAVLAALDRLDFSPSDLDKAIGAARNCFALFLCVTREALDR